MPRELITLQIGQCGIQLGSAFWDLALREHAAFNKTGVFDDALSSMFRNVDSRRGVELPVGDGKSAIKTLKARAVLVDMESGVINELLKGQNADLFDTQQLLNDVSGSGNNWAHGHEEYGPKYREKILDIVRRTTEHCDSLQSFFFIHSLGGGTGSGLGTSILKDLEDNFPEVYRFVAGVFPSTDDDVVTSPYNSTLAISELIDHADCVLPIENEALLDIIGKIDGKSAIAQKKDQQIKGSVMHATDLVENKGEKKKSRSKPFDHMNTIAAHVLTNLTASMRFQGDLNTDLNEITINLVPFPRMHFLIPALSPLYTLTLDGKSSSAVTRGIDHMFADAFSPDQQLIKSNPKGSTYLACALLARGNVAISDMERNIAKLKPSLNMVHWNEDGFKTGLCKAPPVNQPYSLLGLSNNCCIRDTFTNVRDRCMKLYRVKAHLHHYTEYMPEETLVYSLENLRKLTDDYRRWSAPKPRAPQRMRVLTA